MFHSPNASPLDRLVSAVLGIWFGPGVEVFLPDADDRQRGLAYVVQVFFSEGTLAVGVSLNVLRFIGQDRLAAKPEAHSGSADLALVLPDSLDKPALLLPGQALRGALRSGAWGRPEACDGCEKWGFCSGCSHVSTSTPSPAAALATIDCARDEKNCQRCGAPAPWSEVRGGSPISGCSACRPEGPSPWALHLQPPADLVKPRRETPYALN